ncbi:hypothetical protein RRV45_10655 [Bacillus sp. DTU_2020_1000418_1_SI_GHA_SEK_038]|uniref:hypothetical protein n=1 Tax=Bacillus sp. DTU_2020_1000418_1_SI_GHA_SEK_038 TaxID=3077585 RepID=UPI0028E1EEA5|nr:hypothetical protein [Bacillus sp. DTU_2020_1000418_1_SI_GHA_SEK_038]WNS77415.1 hypothetical protein RRV45_10655 [Bacillus sp. DTU_2020_1000418_1_SI_GHA_SEK_038]
MRKEIVFALAAFFFITLSAMTGAYAGENSSKMITISKDKEDVTGDGKKDEIILKGLPYEEGTDFLKEIYMEIQASNKKSFNVEFDSGFNPRVNFIDLNHDGLKDIFVTVDTGGSGGITNHYLYTVKNFALTDLTVPEPLVINSQFLDGYKAAITIQDTGESYTFDLSNRAEDYERTGLYQKGKLSEPTELMVDPFSTLKPVLVDGKQYGLKGTQAISGAYHADRIAIIESLWLYEDGKWSLKNTRVMETNLQKKKK